MNSGSNHPAATGGRGRKRRRGRRSSPGAAAPSVVAQGQEVEGQPAQNFSRAPQAKPAMQGKPPLKFKPKVQAYKHADVNGNGTGKPRIMRTVVNHKTPDASVYSAPMDHSYRSLNHEGAGQQGYSAMPIGENASTRPIVAFIDDLFFLAKVQETARKLNVKVNFVKTDKEVIELAAAAGEKPSLIIIDLNHHTVKPLTVIPKLKTKFKKETNIIGFLSHLQGELKVKAQEAGCDMVLPRSAFSQNLPQLLRRHAACDAEELQEY